MLLQKIRTAHHSFYIPDQGIGLETVQDMSADKVHVFGRDVNAVDPVFPGHLDVFSGDHHFLRFFELRENGALPVS